MEKRANDRIDTHPNQSNIWSHILRKRAFDRVATADEVSATLGYYEVWLFSASVHSRIYSYPVQNLDKGLDHHSHLPQSLIELGDGETFVQIFP